MILQKVDTEDFEVTDLTIASMRSIKLYIQYVETSLILFLIDWDITCHKWLITTCYP